MLALRKIGVVSLVLFLAGTNSVALDDGLARTPPMGWNCWNYAKAKMDCAGMKRMGDAMVSSGMRDAGYRFVNIDDCWAERTRDAKGGIRARTSKFPDGVRACADYLHSKGLKFGLYTDVADSTCADCMPGMRGHEQQDADTFVAWGVDYAKVDWCYGRSMGSPQSNIYAKIRDAFKNAVPRMKPKVPDAHPMVLSLCSWGKDNVWEWADTVGHLWRISGDIGSSWSSIMTIVDKSAGLYSHAGPGGWNDPDMMEVGNGMTESEDRSHFSLWCMLAAPLIAGNDLTKMSAATTAILTNAEAIAVNQDSLGSQGRRIKKDTNTEVWAKSLRNKDCAVLFFNRGLSSANISITWREIESSLGVTLGSTLFARDLWKKRDLGPQSNGYTANSVPSHDVTMLRLSSRTVGVAPKTLTASSANISVRHGNNKVIVDAGRSGSVEVKLTDIKGSLIHSQRTSAPAQLSIPTGHLSEGIYFVRVQTGSGAVTETVVRR